MPRTPESSNVVSVWHMAEIKWWSVAEQGKIVCQCTPPFCHLVCMTRQENGGSLQAPNHPSIYVKVCTNQRSNIVEMFKPPASLIVEVAGRLSITLSPSVAWTTWVCPCTTTRQPVACTHMGDCVSWCMTMHIQTYTVYIICVFSVHLSSYNQCKLLKVKENWRFHVETPRLCMCFWYASCRSQVFGILIVVTTAAHPVLQAWYLLLDNVSPAVDPHWLLLALPRSRKQHWQRAEGILLDRVSQIHSKSDCTSTTSALHTRTISQCWSVFYIFLLFCEMGVFCTAVVSCCSASWCWPAWVTDSRSFASNYRLCKCRAVSVFSNRSTATFRFAQVENDQISSKWKYRWDR